MVFKMSEQAQTVKIFNLRSDINEFIGAGEAYIKRLNNHQKFGHTPQSGNRLNWYK